MKSVLVVANGGETVKRIRSALAGGYQVAHVADTEAALRRMAQRRCDLVFLDIAVWGEGADEARYAADLKRFAETHPAVDVVVMAPRERVREAVRAVRAGARNYLIQPADPDEIRLVAESAGEREILRSELDYLRDRFWKTDSREIIQTGNPAMRQVFAKVRSVAPTRTTVLLVGETGTGKGVIARLIHHHSNREDAQFISVHCGAIPDTLLESELFGHEKGSFTGAIQKKLGKFEIAHRGTIFLDEIGTVTPPAQIKLLQVLQDGTFSRVGGGDVLTTGARVITATNADLKAMSEAGSFRKDLYYRLNVFPIEIPPLRERIEDIAHLANIFLTRLNRKMGKGIREVHPEVVEAMKHYPWPGNIRELENLMERAYILETASVLTPDAFPAELTGLPNRREPDAPPVDTSLPLAEARRLSVSRFEARYIRELILRNRGKVNRSAEQAGISTRQLHKLMLKYGIRKEAYKVPPGEETKEGHEDGDADKC